MKEDSEGKPPAPGEGKASLPAVTKPAPQAGEAKSANSGETKPPQSSTGKDKAPAAQETKSQQQPQESKTSSDKEKKSLAPGESKPSASGSNNDTDRLKTLSPGKGNSKDPTTNLTPVTAPNTSDAGKPSDTAADAAAAAAADYRPETPLPCAVAGLEPAAYNDTTDLSDNPDQDDEHKESEPRELFRPFTQESYKRLLIREEKEKKKALEKKNKPTEGRLVDGELKFDGGEEEEAVPEKDPSLTEGNPLPDALLPFPKKLSGKPLEEIDPFLKGQTFVVIGSRFNKKYIHRFSATRAFFLLAPWNPLRRFAVYIATHPVFDYFVILTILVNCVFLALTTPIEEAEFVFLGIYTLECLVKLTARGFFLNKYTYLRDPWNWLDFSVILLGYVTIILNSLTISAIGNIQGIRTFRVVRVLKTVSIVPGLKTIVNALLRSLKMMLEVMLLIMFCMMVFALFALQVYMGSLRQKCVNNIPADVNVTDSYYLDYIKNSSNWVIEDGDYKPCGNASGAGLCPANSTCLPGIGENPNWGYTNYDQFGWAMLNSFQLITLDFWEDQYDRILRVSGPWNIIFFFVVVFIGSFYLINLMLAVVSMSYEEEALNADKLEKEAGKKNKKGDKQEMLEFDANNLKIHRVDPEEKKRKEKEKQEKKERKKKKKKKVSDKEKAGLQTNLDVHHLQVVDVHSIYSSSNGSLHSVYSNGHLKNSYTSLHSNLDLNNSLNHSKNNITNFVEADMNSPKAVMVNNNNHANVTLVPITPALGTVDSGMGSTDNLLSKEPGSPVRRNSRRQSTVSVLRLLQQGSEGRANAAAVDGKEADEPPTIIVEKDVDSEQYIDHNCGCCERGCVDYVTWLKFQNKLEMVVSNPFFEGFITFCILMNTIIMAIEHHGMSQALEDTLKYSNYVFLGIFTMEAVLKLLALSKDYFKNGWNIFDFVVVVVSYVDLIISEIELDSIPNFSVFRSFRLVRLMRVFKLAQSWSTMRVLLSIIFSTLGALGNLSAVLFLIIFIFAVVGMQLFQNKYTPEKFYPDDVPRWHFDDIFHSILLIFRVLCGEWIEPLWDCMRADGEICMIVFIPTLVFGNFMLLNLFLALLLNAFGTDTMQSVSGKDEKADTGVSKGWKRLKNLFKARSAMVGPVNQKKMSTNGDALESKEEGKTVDNEGVTVLVQPAEQGNSDKANNDNPNQVIGNGSTKTKPLQDVDSAFKTPRDQFAEFNSTVAASRKNADTTTTAVTTPTTNSTVSKTNSTTATTKSTELALSAASPAVSPSVQVDKTPENEAADKDKKTDSTADEITVEATDPENDLPPKPKPLVKKATVSNMQDDSSIIHDCFPAMFYLRCKCLWCCNDSTTIGQRWYKFRRFCLKMTEHKVFEYSILFLIATSSIALCFESVYLDDYPVEKEVLKGFDIAFAVIFTLEMLLKWVGHGLKKYFTTFWTILDFLIVAVSIISLVAEASASEQASQIQSLRALRTLRALRPLRAISRWQSMKIVVNALFHAVPAIGNVVVVILLFWTIFSIAGVQLFGGKFFKCLDADGNKLLHTIVPNKSVCLSMSHLNYTWRDSKINFNNIFIGLVALFQVATFEGWIEVMEDAIDMTEVDKQPIKEYSIGYYIFFVFFIIVGSFFTLNLIIGVIIENFNVLKKKYEGNYLDMLLTPSQKNYYNTLKRLGGKKPQKTIKRPKNRVQGFFFDISISSKFELAIVFLIFLNMCSMMLEYYNQPQLRADIVDIINIVFTTIFTLEAVVKIIGLRWHYFRRAWNVYDFIIVILSIVALVLDDIIRDIFITPTLLRVVRVFRIGRVLRLVKAAKGIRKLLFALVISLPALMNVAALLFLIMFIYAILGMVSFGHVKKTFGMNDLVNFETFPNSIILLFRLTTSAGWNEILDPLMIQPPDCDTEYATRADGVIVKVTNGDCGNPGLAIFFMVSFTVITWFIVINMYIAIILENFNQAHEQEEVGLTEDDFEMFYVVWERYDPHASQFIKYEYLSDLIGDLDAPLGIPKPNEIAIVAFDLPIVEGDKLHCLDILISLVKHVLGDVELSDEFKEAKSKMDEVFSNQFPTRVTTEVKTSTMKRKKMDVAARTLQRAWRKHKLQKNMRQLMEMALEERNTLERSHTKESFGRRLSSAIGSAFRSLSRPSSAKSRSNVSLKGLEGSTSRRPSVVNNTLKVPSAMTSPRGASGSPKKV